MAQANGRADLRAMLEKMLLIRAYEEKAAAMRGRTP